MKTCVVFADGCEEVEGLSVVDVLRRLNIPCVMAGLTDTTVKGDHGIILTCDQIVNEDLMNFDAVILPGGMQGSANFRDDPVLTDLMVRRHEKGLWDCAMCAAPRALAKYGVLSEADFTCYPGIEREVLRDAANARFHEEITVTDQDKKIITSRGPATAWAFGYAIAEALGVDTKALKQGMLYPYLADHIRESL